MANKIVRYTVTLTFAGGLLTRQAGGIRFGLDQAMLRHREDGTPVLPGTLIKGNLRHVWEGVVANGVGDIDQHHIRLLLGQPPTEKENDTEESRQDSSREAPASRAEEQPQRGLLLFDDLWVATKETDSVVRHRIRMDEERGAVAKGALLMAEQVLPKKDGTLSFRGRIELVDCRAFGEEPVARKVKCWIANGLAYAQALGAFKGLGWGKLRNVQVEMEEISFSPISLSAAKSSADAEEDSRSAIGLRVTLDRPFCIPRPMGGEGNIFVSEEFIPGAVLKGALAATLDRRLGEDWKKDYGESFDRIRFTHAFPVVHAESGNPRRPLVVPWSLAIARDANGEEEIVDLADVSRPPEEYRGLRFPMDWKEKEKREVKTRLGWPDTLQRELRVRNRIDPKSGTTEEKALFTVESIVPERHCWLANLHASTGDLQWLKELLKALPKSEYPVYPLGRTKARACFEVFDTPWPTYGMDFELPVFREGDTIRLLLQTPARLLDVGACLEIPPTGGETRLAEQYENVWRELSGGALAYCHHYGRQMLMGGDYWWRHYIYSCDGSNEYRPDEYRPELFTAPGSLFVLEVKEPDGAQKRLLDWQEHGLSYGENMAGGEEWKYNPWLTRNGFGEVVIDPGLPYGRVK